MTDDDARLGRVGDRPSFSAVSRSLPPMNNAVVTGLDVIVVAAVAIACDPLLRVPSAPERAIGYFGFSQIANSETSARAALTDAPGAEVITIAQEDGGSNRRRAPDCWRCCACWAARCTALRPDRRFFGPFIEQESAASLLTMLGRSQSDHGDPEEAAFARLEQLASSGVRLSRRRAKAAVPSCYAFSTCGLPRATTPGATPDWTRF